MNHEPFSASSIQQKEKYIYIYLGFAEINGGDQKLWDFKQLIQSSKAEKAKQKLQSGRAVAGCIWHLAKPQAPTPDSLT